MANSRTLAFGVSFVAAVVGLAVQHLAYAASCEAVVGKWNWFTGSVVTIKADGTMVHEAGNDGTWECTDAARGRVTLRWRLGGYINQLALSADGRGLSSTDASQSFVTAMRVGASTEAKAAAKAADVPQTKTPIGSLPSLNAKVTALRFFETPYNAPPREQREYAHRFGKGEARFIGWELVLEFPSPGRRLDLPIEQFWYRSDGSLLARQTSRFSIEANWTWFSPYDSWGWKDRGNWPAGAYRVDLYIGGQKTASGSFKIYAAPNNAITAYNAGNRFFHAGKYSEAIAYFDQAIRLYPEYAEAYNNRCAVYGELGKYDQAIADCTQALRIDPTHAHAYSNRGIGYRKKGQNDQAMADYAKAIALHPNYASAYVNRGNFYYDTGEHAKALADWHKAQALGQTLGPVTEKRFAELRQAAQASKPAPQTTKQSPPKVAPEDLAEDIEQYDSLDRRVSKLAYEKQWEDAIRMCDQQVATQPNFFGGYALRAWVRLDELEEKHGPDFGQEHALREQLRRQLDVIMADANKAVQFSEAFDVASLLKSENSSHTVRGTMFETYIQPKIYMTRARARHHANDFDGAITDYSKAEVPMLSAEATTGIGRAKAMKNDLRGAVEQLSTALFFYTYAPAYLERARVYVRLRQSTEAIADFSQGLELIETREIDDPLDIAPAQLARLAKVYGERAAAKRAAQDNAGADQDASWQRALLYEREQQWSKARDAYTQLINPGKTAPEQAHAFYSRARTHSRLGEVDQALRDADRAIELAATPSHYAARAGIRLQKGDPARAIEDYTRVLGLLTEKHKQLYGVGLISRAEAYRQNKQFDLALADLKAVQDQSLGYRQNARQHGVRGLVYTALHQQREADESLQYSRNNDEWFFEANIQPELDKLIEKQRRPSDPKVARLAWELGEALGKATFESLQAEGAGKSTTTLAVASERAKVLNVTLPTLTRRRPVIAGPLNGSSAALRVAAKKPGTDDKESRRGVETASGGIFPSLLPLWLSSIDSPKLEISHILSQYEREGT
jgi:tetratricopeptide (TPR) repeat protein